MSVELTRFEHDAAALRRAARRADDMRQACRLLAIALVLEGAPRTEALAAIVTAGPDVAKHGVVRWRCVDLQGEIKSRFAVDLSERQVERILKKLNFVRLSVRPRHPQADPEAQAAHKKTSPA